MICRTDMNWHFLKPHLAPSAPALPYLTLVLFWFQSIFQLERCTDAAISLSLFKVNKEDPSILSFKHPFIFSTAYPAQDHAKLRVPPRGLGVQGRGHPGQGADSSHIQTNRPFHTLWTITVHVLLWSKLISSLFGLWEETGVPRVLCRGIEPPTLEVWGKCVNYWAEWYEISNVN